MNSVSFDDTSNDADDGMLYRNTGMKIVAPHRIDTLSVWTSCDSFCTFDHIDWDNGIQSALLRHLSNLKRKTSSCYNFDEFFI